ncbi:DUF2490 domain-containing protein [Salinimicrobium xinjiangense]|uniref:DUF2490 domain-containing protein n=1 Tax=Salinimicrobium xinjiangense TaxID=438596 RepID=UPI0004055027|nr:DUF2490 domain-containing protein [Salinimicrobium xinjiangense]
MIQKAKKSYSSSTYLLLFTFLLFYLPLHSQDTHALLLEPVVRVVINDTDSWSYSFGVAHRGILLETYDKKRINGYNTEHLEFNHYTRYRISGSSAVALRFRYRINTWFNESRTNEQRIIQEYLLVPGSSFLNLWHRARFEQRFVDDFTIFRGRYRIGITQALSQEFSIGASTEALYSLSSKLKPQPEQRFMLSLENTSIDDLDLNVGLEYRLDNYIRDPVRHTFIYTSATIYL